MDAIEYSVRHLRSLDSSDENLYMNLHAFLLCFRSWAGRSASHYLLVMALPVMASPLMALLYSA